ncbi:MAG TPA: winged helix-turn-helix domain-containing protein [Phycisphaerae bacterium]|nr:winged helix-turn-helix domain-containing protein [Phycisphaerae bacterium]
MKVRDAIVMVLRDARRPLRVADIVDVIWAGGLCAISGITPERTVSSVLTREISKRGDSALFRRVGRGLYVLRQAGSSSASHKKPMRA